MFKLYVGLLYNKTVSTFDSANVLTETRDIHNSDKEIRESQYPGTVFKYNSTAY